MQPRADSVLLYSHNNTFPIMSAAEGLPEVVSPKKGLQVESASRLEYDRSKWLRLPTEGGVDPEKADAHFMRCLLELLRKVGQL